jgi:type II protein arginine methyltransferase
MNDDKERGNAVALDLSRVPADFRPFASALLARPGAEEALVRLLGTIGEKAPREAAEAFAMQLRQALPDSAYLRRVTDVYLRQTYPSWYIQALADRQRNDAYASSLARLVTPASIVVEVGTGSGLFAMMAARAGAEHVYACEILPEVAAIAIENIARNGLSDRITVINTDAKLLHETKGFRRADLLIHEFVSGEFLNAGMHKIIAGYRKHLLKPEGLVLPRFLGARGRLVADEWLLERVRAPSLVHGLDVSSIDRLALFAAPVSGPVPIESPMSDDIDLVEIDLCDHDGMQDRTLVREVTATADGIVRGLLQWVVQRFPDGTVYENRPEDRCTWKPIFWPFNRPISVSKGERIGVRVRHTATELFIEEA